jgi:hypothetical protein
LPARVMLWVPEMCARRETLLPESWPGSAGAFWDVEAYGFDVVAFGLAGGALGGGHCGG